MGAEGAVVESVISILVSDSGELAIGELDGEESVRPSVRASWQVKQSAS